MRLPEGLRRICLGVSVCHFYCSFLWLSYLYFLQGTVVMVYPIQLPFETGYSTHETFVYMGMFVSLSLMLYYHRRYFFRYLFVHVMTFIFMRIQSSVFDAGRSCLCAILATILVFPYASQHEIDSYALCVLVEVVIGRWGCIFTGVWDGTVGEEVWWGVDQGDGKLRIPSALFESMFCACMLLHAFYRRHIRGTIAGIYYLLFRAINDHYRPSTRGQYEYMCIFLAFVMWIRHVRTRQKTKI